MIISIALIFLPLLAFLGTLINSTGVFYFFIVLGAIGYFYSITSAIIASIKFYRYIQNNYYSYKYLNTHKNYNLIYLLFFYILLSILLSSDIFYYVYHYYGVDAGTILYLGISVLVYLIFLIIPILIFRKLNLKYSIKEKLPYLIFGLLIFATTIVLFMIDRYIFNIPLLLIPGQIVNYFGFKNLKEKK